MSFQGSARYELLRPLGQGGMGAVYAVFDRRRQRKLALKVLSDPEGGSLFRFKQEFRAMADLRHPNLVRLYDLGALPPDEGGFFFTMELVEGADLAAWADGGAPATVEATVDALAETAAATAVRVTPSEEATRVARGPGDLAAALCDVARGLACLHAARKVHRDLKPSNVIVGDDGRARLLDFGILRDLDRAGLTGEGAVGTPLYMAPEQVAGEEVGPPADLYALGCVLYRVLTGAPPFSGTAARVLVQHLREEPPPPSERRPCDPELERLCLELLAKEPEARPTADEVAERLRTLGGDAAATAAATATPPPRVPALVGRDDELRALEAAYPRDLASARVVFVAGESGVGKSALAAELARRVSATPWLGGCYEREQVPYRAFDAIVDAAAVELARRGAGAQRLLPPGVQALARLFPVLREVAAVRGLEPDTPLQDAAAECARAARAMVMLLANLSGGAPPLLVIDDLQRADAESAATLRWLVETDAPPPCLVLGTLRPGEVGDEHPIGSLLADAVPRDAWEASPPSGRAVGRLDLDPLEREAARALARDCAPATLSAPALERLLDEAAGNPFLVVELARAAGLAAGDAPPTLEELIRTRLSRVGAGARTLVEIAAVAGGRAGFSLLSEAGGLDGADTAEALDDLLRVQLVREVAGVAGEDAYALIHDRVRTVIYDGLPEERRQELHRTLGDALLRRDDPARAAPHWRLAGDPARAREAALDAARVAERALAFDQAAELYGLAAQSDAGPELAEARAAALSKAGRHREAAEAYAALAADPAAPAAREHELNVATERLAAGDVAGGMDALERVLRRVGSRLYRSVVASLVIVVWRLVRLACGWGVRDLFARWGGSAGRRCARSPTPDEAFRLEVYSEARACLTIHRPLESVRLGAQHALLARAYDDPAHLGRARIGYGFVLGAGVGQLAMGRARHHLRLGEALCDAAGDADGLLQALMASAFMELLAGNWAAVRRLAAESDALARRAGLFGHPNLTTVENIHLGVELLRGDLRAAVPLAERTVRAHRARGNVAALAWPLLILGSARLMAGEHDRGRAALSEALELTPTEPLTVVRLQVEAAALMLYLIDDEPEAGLAAAADLRRRRHRAGVFASTLEAGTLLLNEARLRLLHARQGGRVDHCHLRGGFERLRPLPTTLEVEFLRLHAAVACHGGRLRRGLQFLDRSVTLAAVRDNVLAQGLSLTARARVREALDAPGADLDRRRGAALLEEAGATDGCFLLRVEGWDGIGKSRSCRVGT